MKKGYFSPVNSQVSFTQIEEDLVESWKERKIFEKSLSLHKDKWNFLDGPPFITGLPHYGTLLSSIPKDVFPRYKTMNGYSVRRVWGWDCHGLPAENKVETKLGIKRKKDIEEKVGIKKFIDECKLYVNEVSSEWEWYINHIARWVDFDKAYKTMDFTYTESVMWVFKSMYDKGYIYKGLRVSLYCPHCSTPISNFEVAMDPDNYKEVEEPANTYKYKVVGEDNTYLLAWSTTPWNKIATPALAVNKDLIYARVKEGNEYYILAKETLGMLKTEDYKIVESFKGEKLLGTKFEPHYDYYKIEEGKNAFIVINGDFVTATDGTGIVTIAAYGEDDLAVMKKENIQIVQHVDEEGFLKKDVPKWGGKYYLDVNELVNEDLNERGLMYSETQHTHTIPTCWRCHTRLFYSPQDAWYVDIQKLKPIMEKTNEEVNWYPSHFKHGRFLKSMQSAPDWCISRSRYWGAPVPVWQCECGERTVIGSVKELEELSGTKITELHKPEIDNIEIKCKSCGQMSKRVPEVLDSWIEAGSASFAERHYPFDESQNLNDFFPPDFIVEYTGQIRAWFFVLHVIAAALYEKKAFKNVVVTGVILGTDGRKMSKNYGNYPDPRQMLEKYGGDALRLYLLSSPVMRGEDARISEDEYRNFVKVFLLPLWNIYNFFVTYANIDEFQPKTSGWKPENILDKWIISKMNQNIVDITQNGFEQFDTPTIINLTREFIVNDLSGWFVRRIRDRVGPATRNSKDDKENAHQTLWFVLETYMRVLAPIIPFTTEEIYRNITKEESVHLQAWPKINPDEIDTNLIAVMDEARKAVEQAHAKRKDAGIKLRQPLAKLTIKTSLDLSLVEDVIKDEVNVEAIEIVNAKDLEVEFDLNITEKLRRSGELRELIRQIQDARKKEGLQMTDLITLTLPEWPEEYEDEIKTKTLATKIEKGDELSVAKITE